MSAMFPRWCSAFLYAFSASAILPWFFSTFPKFPQAAGDMCQHLRINYFQSTHSHRSLSCSVRTYASHMKDLSSFLGGFMLVLQAEVLLLLSYILFIFLIIFHISAGVCWLSLTFSRIHTNSRLVEILLIAPVPVSLNSSESIQQH